MLRENSVTDTNLTLMVQITGSFWKDWISFISDPGLKNRADYIRKALECDKYVISDTPMALEPEEIRELFALAKAHQVVLVEKLTMVYLRAFTQLVWLTHGALVGGMW